MLYLALFLMLLFCFVNICYPAQFVFTYKKIRIKDNIFHNKCVNYSQDIRDR